MNAILILAIIPIGLVWLTGLKALIGFHFPWEKCECCGKKYQNHVKFNGRLYKNIEE